MAREVEPRLGTLLKRAEQAMLRAKNQALKPVGITLAQHVALRELERDPGVTAATLSRACQVSPQAMMILLKGMDQQGLITRAAHPRHPNVLEVHITAVGREALHAGRAAIEPVEQRIAAAFSETELKGFAELLVRFSRTLEPGR
jgi:DNA-binding MarR family transcriptional regulator